MRLNLRITTSFAYDFIRFPKTICAWCYIMDVWSGFTVKCKSTFCHHRFSQVNDGVSSSDWRWWFRWSSEHAPRLFVFKWWNCRIQICHCSTSPYPFFGDWKEPKLDWMPFKRLLVWIQSFFEGYSRGLTFCRLLPRSPPTFPFPCLRAHVPSAVVSRPLYQRSLLRIHVSYSVSLFFPSRAYSFPRNHNLCLESVIFPSKVYFLPRKRIFSLDSVFSPSLPYFLPLNRFFSLQTVFSPS